MEMEELQHYLQQNPNLLPVVYRFDEHVGQLSIIPPDSSSAKYDAFCSRLSLKKKPWLVVYADDIKHDTPKHDSPIGNYDAFYYPEGNAVFMKRSCYDDFCEGSKLGEYAVAHEAGHAKSLQSRRLFLGKTLALAGGALTGIATGVGVSKVENDLLSSASRSSHPSSPSSSPQSPPPEKII